MKIGIVIPTKDATAEPAQTSIALARKTTAHLDAAVIPVQDSGPGFRFSRSINRGVAQAPDADAWVLLNDDAFMDAGWLDAMIAVAQAHPEVAVVGAVLRYPDGGLQHAGGRVLMTPGPFLAEASYHRAPLWALRMLAKHRFRPFPYMYTHWRSVSPRHRLDFITAACALVTRRAWEALGGYDERYEFGCEDSDFSLRAREAGFELALATRATGVHLEGKSSGQMSERQKRSLATFEQTWSAERIRKATRGRVGVYG